MIQTNLANQIEINKPVMTAVKNDLAIFHKAFNSYWKIDMQSNYIIFILPSHNLVERSRDEAEALIESLNLDLSVIGTGRFSTTFIVKLKGGVE
jgi:hypothetical protein